MQPVADGHICEADNAPCAHRQRCIQTRWVLASTLFGTFFPIVGWIVAVSDPAVATLAAAHRMQPVLYIVDLAPLVLGVTGFFLGFFHARLLRVRHSIELTVHERTAELEQALTDLSATQAEKDRFVASVSHELRTPLTSVVGLAHAVVEADPALTPEEQLELLGLIISESEEVAAIVEDLLVAARVESGELTINTEEIHLDEELRAMVEVCEVQVTPRRVEPTTAVADRVRVHQIVRNLITNADRYGGDAVVVETFEENGTAVLAVRDNGPGVPADKVDLIFAAYGKGHNDPNRTESVGLGLAVSRNLARLMGGDVVYSRPNGWTSFELRLPASTATGSSPELATRTPEGAAYANST